MTYALLAVIGNMVKEEWNIIKIIFGALAAVGFFLWGYFLEGGGNDG